MAVSADQVPAVAVGSSPGTSATPSPADRN
jgi:hypothetical protein